MRAFTRVTLCCSAAIVALSASIALADQQIGNVVQKDFNGAKGLRVAATSADDLMFNHDVFAGETVNTSGSASTVIRFQDQTQIQVGSNSSIVLDKFVYDPASGTGDAAIKFGTGVFRFITGDIKNKDAVKLTTPTTSLTIRGTKFILAVAADGTTSVGVLEGAVEVSPCGGNRPVTEPSGKAVRVGADCKASSVSMGSVTTDVTTSTDYDVAQNERRHRARCGRHFRLAQQRRESWRPEQWRQQVQRWRRWRRRGKWRRRIRRRRRPYRPLA